MKSLIPVLVAGLAWVSPGHSAPLTDADPMVSASTYLDIARAGVRVVAVGDRGHIIYSDNEGKSWQVADVPTKALLTGVCFTDARNGFAVGHDAVVLATTDGGVSWSVKYSDVLGSDDDAGAEENMDEIDYSDDIYSDDIYSDDLYSDDPYDAEEDYAAPDTSGAPFLDVLCAENGNIIAVGGFGYFIQSSDGGETWKKRMSDLDNRDGWHLYGITQVPGSDTLLVAGEKGILFRSRDAGRTWTKLDSPYAGSLFGINAISKEMLVTYGLQGNVFVSTNQGDSWRRVKSGVTRALNDSVTLNDGTVVLVGGSGVVLVSHDNMASVTLQYLPERDTVSSLIPLSSGDLLMAGESGVSTATGIR